MSNILTDPEELVTMALKVFYEPETELLTVFWQDPRKEQICTELGDGVILIKDSISAPPKSQSLICTGIIR